MKLTAIFIVAICATALTPVQGTINPQHATFMSNLFTSFFSSDFSSVMSELNDATFMSGVHISVQDPTFMGLMASSMSGSPINPKLLAAFVDPDILETCLTLLESTYVQTNLLSYLSSTDFLLGLVMTLNNTVVQTNMGTYASDGPFISAMFTLLNDRTVRKELFRIESNTNAFSMFLSMTSKTVFQSALSLIGSDSAYMKTLFTIIRNPTAMGGLSTYIGSDIFLTNFILIVKQHELEMNIKRIIKDPNFVSTVFPALNVSSPDLGLIMAPFLPWPHLCGSQNKESPVDIDTGLTGYSSRLRPFRFKGKSFRRFHVSDITIDEHPNYFQFNFNVPANARMEIKMPGLRGYPYKLEKCLYFWRRENGEPGGSEHTLNGTVFDSELQCFLKSGRRDKLSRDYYAAFAIFINYISGGAIESLVLPGLANAVSSNGSALGSFGKIDLRYILPSTPDSYYRYFGSQTTGSCDKNVAWTVFRDPVLLDSNQFGALTSAGFDFSLLVNPTPNEGTVANRATIVATQSWQTII